MVIARQSVSGIRLGAHHGDSYFRLVLLCSNCGRGHVTWRGARITSREELAVADPGPSDVRPVHRRPHPGTHRPRSGPREARVAQAQLTFRFGRSRAARASESATRVYVGRVSARGTLGPYEGATEPAAVPLSRRVWCRSSCANFLHGPRLRTRAEVRNREHDRPKHSSLYEIVLREGGADDLVTYIDGALLVDMWDELVVPRVVRHAWQP